MLESMARASSNHPNVMIVGMPVDNEIFVAGIFVLAYTRLKQRRIPHPRESVSEIFACVSDTICTH
jgi:hypothetical protein